MIVCRVALLLAILSLPAGAATFYVAQDGDNTDGLSWETAFTTISAGLNARGLDRCRKTDHTRGVHKVSFRRRRNLIDDVGSIRSQIKSGGVNSPIVTGSVGSACLSYQISPTSK